MRVSSRQTTNSGTRGQNATSEEVRKDHCSEVMKPSQVTMATGVLSPYGMQSQGNVVGWWWGYRGVSEGCYTFSARTIFASKAGWASFANAFDSIWRMDSLDNPRSLPISVSFCSGWESKPKRRTMT